MTVQTQATLLSGPLPRLLRQKPLERSRLLKVESLKVPVPVYSSNPLRP